MIFSTFMAVSTFCGYGIPWEIIVDSSATTGRRLISASLTAGDTDKYFFMESIAALSFSVMGVFTG